MRIRALACLMLCEYEPQASLHVHNYTFTFPSTWHLFKSNNLFDGRKYFCCVWHSEVLSFKQVPPAKDIVCVTRIPGKQEARNSFSFKWLKVSISVVSQSVDYSYDAVFPGAFDGLVQKLAHRPSLTVYVYYVYLFQCLLKWLLILGTAIHPYFSNTIIALKVLFCK